ncbi:MAG: isochorismate synthase [Moheibacter sp.]
MIMFKAFSEKLIHALDAAIPFVLFRKPAENTVHLRVNDGSGKNNFLFHSFDNHIEKSTSDTNPLQIHQDEFDFEFKLKLNAAPEFQPITQDKYIDLLEKTMKEIRDTEIHKIVISRIKEMDNPGLNIFKSFKNLLDQHPNALVYLWHNPGRETWMGATPELLLSRIDNEVKTVSLAGTKKPENDWTPKEIKEQQIVTDFILENFLETENLKVSGPETVQAGKFQHLKTYISAKVPDEFDSRDLLEKLHPTPAVCGMPKADAFEFILNEEGYNRSFYSGYIGLESESTQEFFVNLRCTQIFRDKIWVYVGGGITADSIPENEWLETELKSGTILNALR